MVFSKTLDGCAFALIDLGAEPAAMPQAMGGIAAMGMGLLLLTPPGYPTQARVLFQDYAEQAGNRILGSSALGEGGMRPPAQAEQTDLFP